MTSSEPQEEPVAEPNTEAPETSLTEETLDQATGGAYPLPLRFNPGQGG